MHKRLAKAGLLGLGMVVASIAASLTPSKAVAQIDNRYKPLVTRPSAPQDPSQIDPSQHGLPGNGTGVIVPPPQASQMPVIKPMTPSRMPVIPPPGTPGGNPHVVPK